MSSINRIEPYFHCSSDFLFQRIPRPAPQKEQIEACRIVAHRGVHLRKEAFENTIPAFQRAGALGIWGIEFDIRWTGDLKPVVFHDSDLLRLYGNPKPIKAFSRQELLQAYPAIPSLEEVVCLFGGRLHLMIEIKSEVYPKPAYQGDMLREILGDLQPAEDYHFMSLNPNMFRFAGFAPPKTMIPIPMIRFREFSRLARREGYGGVAGHYLLLSKSVLERHHKLGQKIGTGFSCSRNCLFREINRGVDWIFSDHAEVLQRIIHSEG